MSGRLLLGNSDSWSSQLIDDSPARFIRSRHRGLCEELGRVSHPKNVQNMTNHFSTILKKKNVIYIFPQKMLIWLEQCLGFEKTARRLSGKWWTFGSFRGRCLTAAKAVGKSAELQYGECTRGLTKQNLQCWRILRRATVVCFSMCNVIGKVSIESAHRSYDGTIILTIPEQKIIISKQRQGSEDCHFLIVIINIKSQFHRRLGNLIHHWQPQ